MADETGDATAGPSRPGVHIGIGDGRGPLDPKVVQYIDEQIALTRLQAEDLRREDRIRHWSLRVHHVSDVLKLCLELAAAVVVAALAIFIGGSVWSAAHDNGVVIEAFDVPADFAQRGLTGKVVASQLLDRLQAMQAVTSSERPAATYANN